MTLRQRHTEGAILYEKKLKPFLKSLNEGKGTLPLTLPRLRPSLANTVSPGVARVTVWLLSFALWGSHARPVHVQGGLTRGDWCSLGL